MFFRLVFTIFFISSLFLPAKPKESFVVSCFSKQQSVTFPELKELEKSFKGIKHFSFYKNGFRYFRLNEKCKTEALLQTFFSLELVEFLNSFEKEHFFYFYFISENKIFTVSVQRLENESFKIESKKRFPGGFRTLNTFYETFSNSYNTSKPEDIYEKSEEKSLFVTKILESLSATLEPFFQLDLT